MIYLTFKIIQFYYSNLSVTNFSCSCCILILSIIYVQLCSDSVIPVEKLFNNFPKFKSLRKRNNRTRTPCNEMVGSHLYYFNGGALLIRSSLFHLSLNLIYYRLLQLIIFNYSTISNFYSFKFKICVDFIQLLSLSLFYPGLCPRCVYRLLTKPNCGSSALLLPDPSLDGSCSDEKRQDSGEIVICRSFLTRRTSSNLG